MINLRAAAALPFALAVAGAIAALALPIYTRSDGVHTTHVAATAVNGTWVIVPALFPAAVALIPMIVPLRAVRIGAAIVLAAFVVISGMSIGLFYVPAAIATAANARPTY